MGKKSKGVATNETIKLSAEKILHEGYTLRNCVNEFNVSRSWLRSKLIALQIPELTSKITGIGSRNSSKVRMPSTIVSENKRDKIDDVFDLLEEEHRYKEVNGVETSENESVDNSLYNTSNLERRAIIKYRLSHNMSQKQLSNLCGIGSSTLSDIESGNTRITNKMATRISNGLKLSIKELNEYSNLEIDQDKVSGMAKRTTTSKKLLVSNSEDTNKYELLYNQLLEKYNQDMKSINGNLSKANQDKHNLQVRIDELVDENNELKTTITFLKKDKQDLSDSNKKLSNELQSTIATQNANDTKALYNRISELEALLDKKEKIIDALLR